MVQFLYMETVSYTHARNHLAELTDRVCEDRNPVLITRQGAASVIVMSWDDYRSLEETAYLLRSPKNALRLAESIAGAERGEVVERDLIDAE